MNRLALVCLALAFGLGLHANAGLVWAQSDLNGAWEIVEASGHNAQGDWKLENVQPSLYIFMDGYYSIAQVNGNEARPLMPEGTTWDTMTEEQLSSVCSAAVFSANSGTYEVDGSSLTTKPMVAKWPNFMEGGSASHTYLVENDMLTLAQEGDGWNSTIELRRLHARYNPR